MMSFHCRWPAFLICLCTPCILLALLFTYVTLWICYDMAPKLTSQKPPTPVEIHFIAKGVYRNEGLAPLPSTFWPLQLHKGVIWNQLQLAVDRYYNPILNPKKTREGNATVYKSFEAKMSESFMDIADLDSILSTLPQPIKDFISYMHKRKYPLLLEPQKACGAGANEETEPSLLLLAIKSTEHNFVRRQVIRESWGQVGWVAGQRRRPGEGGVEGKGVKDGEYVRRVFLLGRENQDDPGSEFLNWESKHYRDILQWDFKDSFFNLTLKDINFWDWFSRHCNRVHFLFKGDDDVFVNTPAMVDYLQDRLSKKGTYATMRSFMVGDVLTNTLPIRDTSSKYYIPESFYQGKYPAYGGGGGVVYSGILARRLNHMSRRVHLFPIDDAYVGMCMIRLKSSPTHNPAFLTLGMPKAEEELPCVFHRILLLHKREPYQLIKLWAELQANITQCWNVTLRSEPKDVKTTPGLYTDQLV